MRYSPSIKKKTNFKNGYIPNIGKPKMSYSFSIKDKEKATKVDFVIFSLEKNMSRKKACGVISGTM